LEKEERNGAHGGGDWKLDGVRVMTFLLVYKYCRPETQKPPINIGR